MVVTWTEHWRLASHKKKMVSCLVALTSSGFVFLSFFCSLSVVHFCCMSPVSMVVVYPDGSYGSAWLRGANLVASYKPMALCFLSKHIVEASFVRIPLSWNTPWPMHPSFDLRVLYIHVASVKCRVTVTDNFPSLRLFLSLSPIFILFAFFSRRYALAQIPGLTDESINKSECILHLSTHIGSIKLKCTVVRYNDTRFLWQ